MVSLKSVMLLVLALLFMAVGGYLFYTSSQARRGAGEQKLSTPPVRSAPATSPATDPGSDPSTP